MPGTHTLRGDVIVYGATPAGIAAAVRAAREGARTILVEPLGHVGGVMSSGVATAEFEHMLRDCYSGFNLEVYHRIGLAYGIDEPLFHWEPHVAERVFLDLLNEANVELQLGKFVTAVHNPDGRIRSLTATDALKPGTTLLIEGAAFIDASYEGDLMAIAGVRATWGREGRAQYNEDLAGMTFVERADQVADYGSQIEGDLAPERTIDDTLDISPWNEDRLLPGFVDAAEIRVGEGDGKTANYHYRVTLSTATDRIDIEQPEGYDPLPYRPYADYFRAHAAPDLRDLIDIGSFASGRYKPHASGITSSFDGEKWEANNRQDRPLSLGHLGGQFGYPEASPLERPRFWADHREHALGLFHFLATDKSVPEPVRKQTRVFGLPADEYADNGHFPYALYVREARRMVSDLVFTQHDVMAPTAREDSVGLASHWIDSHYVQRVAVPGRGFRGEGRIWRPVRHLYQMPYRLMLPPRCEARNLLVPVCLSASRVAFCSLRVEAQWMALGEAAGLAAVMAASGDMHDVPTKELQRRLEATGTLL